MIDRNSPLPIYYQLQQLLKEQIESNTLKSGDQLPTEQEMCAQYHISRAPVRQALHALTQEGYIYRQAGVGTFVAENVGKGHTQRIDFRLLASDARWVPLLERAAQRWSSENLGQEIQLNVEVPDRSSFHQVLRTAAVGGNAPDMVSIDYVWLTGYARSGYLTPLDELDANWAQWLGERFETPVARNHTVEGHIFGMPMQADVTGLWYRRDWFEAAGLTPPLTWDEWLALLEYFARPETRTRFGHRYPVSFPLSTFTGEATVNLLLPFLWVAGGGLLDNEGHLALASSAVHRALEFLRSITFEHKYLPPETPNFRWEDPPRLLAHGEVPMTLGGTYELPVLREESGWESEEEFLQHLGFVLIPRPTLEMPSVTSLGGTSWVILKQSPLKELSLELMKLAFSSELRRSFFGKTLQISPLKSFNQHLAVTHPWLREVSPFLSVARPRPMLRQYVRVSRFLQQMFEMVLWEGASIEETVHHTINYLTLLLQD